MSASALLPARTLPRPTAAACSALRYAASAILRRPRRRHQRRWGSSSSSSSSSADSGSGGPGPKASFWEPGVVRSVQIDFRPKRIILLRHGESMGNVDDAAYVATPDWRVPLTERGMEQASRAGEELARVVGEGGRVFFYHSPYMRTRQTMEGLMRHLGEEQVVAVREEPRISEQQFGNFQNVQQVLDAKAERHRFGRFYYRFPSGEAGLDVYSRVSSFITTLVRDCHQYNHLGYELKSMNVVIVTHGLALRLFLMRWFQFSVEEFEASENPENAHLIVMHKRAGAGGHRYYEMDAEDRISLGLPERCGLTKNMELHSLDELEGEDGVRN